MSKKLDRQTSLSARPEQAPVVRADERGDGGLRVTVRLVRRRWLSWLGSEHEVERTFGLDPLGREVYETCDGTRDVKAIIRHFARSRNLARPEAEIAVTTFLRTLVARGLVVMAVDKDLLRRSRSKGKK